MNVVVHTLGYNIAELVEEATESLYQLNPEGGFRHVIADLGYPLGTTREHWDKYSPDAVWENARMLVDIAQHNGSDLIRLPNVGVSQNWTSVAAIYGIGEGDLLIGADPDERPITEGWVNAMATVVKHDPNIAIVALTLPELLALPNFYETYFEGEVVYDGVRVWYGKYVCQWALIGISGTFIQKVGGVPYPQAAPIYGWIEGACQPAMESLGMRWVMLPDYHSGHIASSPLAQAWKNYIVTEEAMNAGQPTFEQWLQQHV